jgi:hypothetical protein
MAHPIGPILTLWDGNDTLSQNISKELPFYAVQYPQKEQISPTSQEKPEIMHKPWQCWAKKLSQQPPDQIIL